MATPRATRDLGALLVRIGVSASSSTTVRELREELLRIVAAEVPFDVALLHEFSPRMPIDRAALVGIARDVLASTMPRWDALAVELGSLRDEAMRRGGVASDLDAFPLGAKRRARWERAVGRPLGFHHALFVHLVVRGRIASVMVLGRRRAPFTASEGDLLRRIAPPLAVADALGQALEHDTRRGPPARLECVDQRLTDKQRELVVGVALGHTNAAIAAAAGVSVNTIRNRLADVMRRLGASNRADVVRLAVLR